MKNIYKFLPLSWLIVAFLFSIDGIAQQDKIEVTGQVVSARSHKSVAGANVSFGDSSVTITDINGNFKIKVSNLYATISIAAADYQSIDYALSGKQQLVINLWEAHFSAIEDEHIFPWGRLKNRYSASSVINEEMSETRNLPFETVDNYLQGRVAGLKVVRRSGTPGIGSNLQLYGINSLYGTNTPLILLDGVIYNSPSNNQQLIEGYFFNPLKDIDIRDIASVTLVRDALSTYGTKAANGVLFINTKKANQEATTINFAVSGTYNIQPQNLSLLNAKQYRLYAADLVQSQGNDNESLNDISFLNDEVKNSDYYMYHNSVNWQNQVFHPSFGKDVYLSVAGGDNIAKYALSLGYQKNDDVYTGNFGWGRYFTRFNADFNISKKVKATTNIAFTHNNQNLFDQGLTLKTSPLWLALLKSPLVSVNERGDNGEVSPNLSGVDTFGIGNPLAILQNGNTNSKNYRFLGNLKIQYQINEHWNLETQFGITFDKSRSKYFVPRLGVASDTLFNAIAYSRLGNQVQRYSSLYDDTRINYDNHSSQKHLQWMLGIRYQRFKDENMSIRSYNSSTDDFTSVGNGTNALREVFGEIGNAHWINNYMQLNYTIRQKYIFQGNLNVDASSRFGKQVANALRIGGNSFAVLPSFGATWIISSEQFWKKITWINLLKIRSSIGLAGNDDIGDYSSKGYYTTQNLLGYQGIVRGNIANSHLQWETNRKFTIGVDLAALDNKLQISFDFYNNRTNNLLTYRSLPAASGLEYLAENRGALSNRGFSLDFQYRILNSAFVWDAGVNISSYKNKVLRLPNGAIENSFAGGSFITSVGYAANSFYGYEANGIFRTTTEANAASLQYYDEKGHLNFFQAGDAHFTDLNGDHIIDNADRKIIGNPNPKWVGGFTQNFTYKKISLNALFSFSQGNEIYNYVRQELESNLNYSNQLSTLQNRWRIEGQNTDIPKVTYGDPAGNNRFSTRWIEDGSYVRLRTLSLGYDLDIFQKQFRSFHIYASASNLFTWTKYKGFDPEFSASESIYGQGVDAGLNPLYKTINFGIQVGL
ncbi:SusC/RagA family TonB-linked outer membrane protein [Rhizosphaericola mali]|uniref:SusC/RagA family TonB-linked outer membrane protein n=1 Tax=Rhizosphaericola mali TaxID=2545455 RepID=A0A5P2G9T3_9BACT|nr:SusC/RagA family TonB-linked outer membrane protein [Rhizosphaericola mali]QES88291.1 SusC/RagA family TonB-linked outer membrane protein [Rhizosphaericola mali]